MPFAHAAAAGPAPAGGPPPVSAPWWSDPQQNHHHGAPPLAAAAPPTTYEDDGAGHKVLLDLIDAQWLSNAPLPPPSAAGPEGMAPPPPLYMQQPQQQQHPYPHEQPHPQYHQYQHHQYHHHHQQQQQQHFPAPGSPSKAMAAGGQQPADPYQFLCMIYNTFPSPRGGPGAEAYVSTASSGATEPAGQGDGHGHYGHGHAHPQHPQQPQQNMAYHHPQPHHEADAGHPTPSGAGCAPSSGEEEGNPPVPCFSGSSSDTEGSSTCSQVTTLERALEASSSSYTTLDEMTGSFFSSGSSSSSSGTSDDDEEECEEEACHLFGAAPPAPMSLTMQDPSFAFSSTSGWAPVQPHGHDEDGGEEEEGAAQPIGTTSSRKTAKAPPTGAGCTAKRNSKRKGVAAPPAGKKPAVAGQADGVKRRGRRTYIADPSTFIIVPIPEVLPGSEFAKRPHRLCRTPHCPNRYRTPGYLCETCGGGRCQVQGCDRLHQGKQGLEDLFFCRAHRNIYTLLQQAGVGPK